MRYTRACLSYLADGAQMGFVRRPLCSNSNSNSSNNISFSSISSARRSSPGSSPLSSLQRPSTTITTITTRQWQVASATDTRLRQVPNHCAFTAGATCVWQRCAAGDTHLAASAAAASYVLSRTAPTVHPGAKAVDQTYDAFLRHRARTGRCGKLSSSTSQRWIRLEVTIRVPAAAGAVWISNRAAATATYLLGQGVN